MPSKYDPDAACHPDISGAIAALKAGDRAYVEPIVRYLELDPYQHGSGYLKEKIWRALRRVELTEKQQQRVRQVALLYVRRRISREFAPMCRMVAPIATPKLRGEVDILCGSEDSSVARRAIILRSYLRDVRWAEEARVHRWPRWFSR